jgi:putative lipoprotein
MSAALTVAAALSSCDSGGRSSDGLLIGSITQRERVALPLNAVVELRLEDVTDTAAPATVLATRSVETAGRQVPITIELRYPPRDVDPGRRYGLNAEIRGGDGSLLFASAKPESVFRDGPTGELVQLVLFRPGPAAKASWAPIANGEWSLASMRREDESVQAMRQGPKYALKFESDGRVSGWAHCYAFNGRYTQGDFGKLSIFRLVAPTTGCPPPSRADEFLGALDRVSHHEVRSAQLVLKYGVGGELTFDGP